MFCTCGLPAHSGPAHLSRRALLGRGLAAGAAASLAGTAGAIDASAEPVRAAAGGKLPPIIDVHSHPLLPFTPKPPNAKLPDWSLDGLIETMDRNGIAATVLSVPQSSNLPKGPFGKGLARKVNDAIAEMVAKHPTRLGAFAILPARDMDAALEEAAYALDTLKFDGICVNSNLDDVYLGEPVFDPLLTELDRRGATLFIHPNFLSYIREPVRGLEMPTLEVPFDSTRMLVNMAISGAKRRFGRINMISAHGGGTLPYLVDRVLAAVEHAGPGAGRPAMTSAELREQFASFYYDLAFATSEGQLTALLDLVPSSRLLMGTDGPAATPPMIAHAIRQVAGFQKLKQADRLAIAHGNAAKILPTLGPRVTAAMRGTKA